MTFDPAQAGIDAGCAAPSVGKPSVLCGFFRFGLSQLLGAISLICVLLIIGVPTYRQWQKDVEFRLCESRLRQIAAALYAYQNRYGQYPPVYIPDASGQPGHSWRVLLLPFLDSTAAPSVAKYSFNEPWDGPNNSKLRKNDPYFQTCPQGFRCPGDRSPKRMTSYVAVAGPKTMWYPNSYVRDVDFMDGLEKTIMVLEIADSDIDWLEPRDVPLEELHKWLQPGSKPSVLASHEKSGIQGGIVVFADGHTEFLAQSISEQQLIEMLNMFKRAKR